jgi:hypothetical protein
MNFVYEPKVAAQIAAYINYVSPVKERRKRCAGSTRSWPTTR